jgi:hypothetical protein
VGRRWRSARARSGSRRWRRLRPIEYVSDPQVEPFALLSLAVTTTRRKITYNRVQHRIFDLFAAFSGMSVEKASGVFLALKSDRSQRDIALAAGKTALADCAPCPLAPALGDTSKSAFGCRFSLPGQASPKSIEGDQLVGFQKAALSASQ